jgi:hypothetical protein
MTSPAYAPTPSYSPDEYQRAKASLADPNLPEKSRAMRTARIAEFEKSQAENDQARGYTQTSQLDPAKEELVKRVRGATRDDALPNASGLKVFSTPTEYEPPVKVNPFSPVSPLSYGAPERNIWHEPSVKDFRAALAAGGSFAERAKAELGKGTYGGGPVAPAPGPNEHASQPTRDITQLGNEPTDPNNYDDVNLERSDTFKAYRDAAWQHALADAVKSGKPIYRLAFTKKLSDAEKATAGAIDTGGAFVGGAGQAATLGLLDPLKRAINPSLATKDRQQRNRNPSAEMAGEFAGGAVGAPEAIVRGSVSALGKKLGGSSLGRLGTSAGAGAITGAADAQVRAIAQSASDALDAGDSAAEMASRIYDSLSLNTTLGGAALGTGAAVTGHALGSAAGQGARSLVGGNAEEVLLHGQDAGLKMGPLGNVEVPKDVSGRVSSAAAQGKKADLVLADELADPLSRERLLQQEAQHRGALEETSRVREALVEPAVVDGSLTTVSKSVGTGDAAQKILSIGSGLSKLTGGADANEIRAIGRRLNSQRQVTPEQLDAHIDALEKRAKSGKEPDPNFLAVKNILLELRDEFHLPDEATSVDNFAIRDKSGNMKPVDGYSGLKKAQETEKTTRQVQNAAMGLPLELKAEPLRMAKAPDPESAQALADSMPPRVKFGPNQRETFVERIATSGNPEGSVRFDHFRDLAALAGDGSSEKLMALKQLRATQNWKQYLGRAINGISPSGGTYLKMNNLLRTVPTLRSLSGGLPKFEATDQVTDIVDRFLESSVPSWGPLNLRGGKPAKFTGAATRDEKGDAAKLTPEETALARAIVQKLLQSQKAQ